MKFQELKNLVLEWNPYQSFWIDEKGTFIPVDEYSHVTEIIHRFGDAAKKSKLNSYSFAFNKGWIRGVKGGSTVSAEFYNTFSRQAINKLIELVQDTNDDAHGNYVIDYSDSKAGTLGDKKYKGFSSAYKEDTVKFLERLK